VPGDALCQGTGSNGDPNIGIIISMLRGAKAGKPVWAAR
jgi:hypothetical protein